MTVGELLSFLAAVLMLYKPLKDVTRTNLALQFALSSASRIFELIDAENEIVEKPGARDLAPLRQAIRYEHVGFHYGEDPVLSDVNLEIRRGETVAIVGPSGAGKTSLVNLLPRLYDPTAGRILWDGVDLRDATLTSLRRQIGLVTQDTILFDATARRKHRLRRSGRTGGARARRGPGGLRRRVPGEAAAGLRHAGRRGRHAPVRAATAAPRDRARALQGCAGADPRRSDVAARHGVRGARRARRVESHGGAHDARHRPPAVHRAPRGPDHRPGGGPDRGDRHARRALDSPRRVPQAARHAVLLRGRARRRLP